jgi:hypothetical protein
MLWPCLSRDKESKTYEGLTLKKSYDNLECRENETILNTLNSRR